MVKKKKVKIQDYQGFLGGISELLTEARRSAARSVNSILTITYWEIGRRIVEFEQCGKDRAGYGEELIKRLAQDLRKRFGRGFTKRNLDNMRQVYRAWPRLFLSQAPSPTKNLKDYRPSVYEKVHSASALLSWTHYRRLALVKSKDARNFYESEAIRGGWSVKQLDRQINTQFYKGLCFQEIRPRCLEKAKFPGKMTCYPPKRK